MAATRCCRLMHAAVLRHPVARISLNRILRYPRRPYWPGPSLEADVVSPSATSPRRRLLHRVSTLSGALALL